MKRTAQFFLPITSLFKERGLDWIVEDRSSRLGAILACSRLKYVPTKIQDICGTSRIDYRQPRRSVKLVSAPTKKENRNPQNPQHAHPIMPQHPTPQEDREKSPPKSHPCSLSATRVRQRLDALSPIDGVCVRGQNRVQCRRVVPRPSWDRGEGGQCYR